MKYLTQNKNWNKIEDYNIDKVLYLLTDRPDYIHLPTIRWLNNQNQWHRNYDFPATIYINVFVSWNINNELIRENSKPSLLFNNGQKDF